jgi:hypothetical protein
MKPTKVLIAALALGLLLAPRAADARPKAFAEGLLGVSVPVADGDFSGLIDPSLKLGARLGYMQYQGDPARVWAFELGVDWSPLADSFADMGGRETRFTRMRALLGPRLLLRVRPDTWAFARVGAGVDLFTVEESGRLGAIDFVDTTAHLGVGLELGGGVSWQWNDLVLGAQVGVPIGFQTGEQPDRAVDVSHTSFALDVLVSVGYRSR